MPKEQRNNLPLLALLPSEFFNDALALRQGSVEAGEGEANNIESVVQKMNDVADKLSGVQSAIETGLMSGGEEREQLGTALLLTEIRKRADVETISKLKKEMFTAVHNVQRRLLEEQVSRNHRLNR